MATGTEGLGLSSTVFDFSGISKDEAQMEEVRRNRARQFKSDNQHLYATPDTSMVRDVDRTYLASQTEYATRLNAKAIQTKNPEDIEAARSQMAKVSSQVAVSMASRKSYEEGITKEKTTEAYGRNPKLFDEHGSKWHTETAMTDANGGNIGEAAVYMSPIFYAGPKENLEDIIKVNADVVKTAALESAATGVTNADGTGFTKSKAGINKETQASEIEKSYVNSMRNPDFVNAIDARIMANYFGTTDLTTAHVSKFNEMRDGSAKIGMEYASIEELRKDPRFNGDPRALLKAEELYKFNTERDTYGKKYYVDAMMAATSVGDKTTKTTDNAPNVGSGGGIGSIAGDYPQAQSQPQSGGKDKSSKLVDVTGVGWGAFGTDAKGNPTFSRASKEFRSTWLAQGTTSAYVGMPKGKQAVIGSGTNRVVVDGVIALKDVNGKETLWSITYTIAPDIAKKLNNLESGSTEWNDLLTKTEANLVPFSQVQALMTKDERVAMVAIAKENLNKGVSEPSSGVGGKYSPK